MIYVVFVRVHEKKELEAKKKEKSVAAEIIDDINAAKEIVDIKKARIEEANCFAITINWKITKLFF